MDYFEFYGLPESFKIDAAQLKKKFYELSKKYHPDFYASESAEKQQEVLELSTLNNKAYQVLANTDRRVEYILRQHNLLSEGDKYPLGPDFLMEMMELNEQLMDADDEATINRIKTSVKEASDNLELELAGQTRDFEIKDKAGQNEAFKKVLDIYYRKKYLLRITESFNTFAAR
ncbi:Fe-S protein assembly co-chaperone HscB [Mucilaginibacter sp.]|uniref:Fe-S protein assembly co-chaperone HscB n=1 Tax=Mucilaginibacter sp. TaxID=1882438 RepID=UPI003B00706E